MGKDLKGKELGVGIRQKTNGIYSARYVDKFGKRKELYHKDLTVLKRRLNEAKYNDSIGNVLVDDSLTLSVWFENWLEIYKYNVIRNNTRMHYKQIFIKHIEPMLGKKRLKDITQLHIRSLLKELDKQGLLQTATFCGQQGRISRTVRAILNGQSGISAGQRVPRPTDQY